MEQTENREYLGENECGWFLKCLVTDKGKYTPGENLSLHSMTRVQNEQGEKCGGYQEPPGFVSKEKFSSFELISHL